MVHTRGRRWGNFAYLSLPHPTTRVPFVYKVTPNLRKGSGRLLGEDGERPSVCAWIFFFFAQATMGSSQLLPKELNASF